MRPRGAAAALAALAALLGGADGCPTEEPPAAVDGGVADGGVPATPDPAAYRPCDPSQPCPDGLRCLTPLESDLVGYCAASCATSGALGGPCAQGEPDDRADGLGGCFLADRQSGQGLCALACGAVVSPPAGCPARFRCADPQSGASVSAGEVGLCAPVQ